MGTWVSSLRKRRGSSSNGKVIANGHDSGNEPPKMENTAALQQWKVDEPYLNLHCSLGEGPYYEKATNSLRFVDIIQRKLHTVSLDKGPESVTTLELDTPISVTSDVEGVDPRDRILVGLKYGLAMLDRKSGKYEYLTKFATGTEGAADDERLRSNDGAADALGRYWLGSMTDFPFGDPAPEGSLFCFAGKKAPDTALTSLRIPNSVGWSPDGKTMYFTHTTASEMLAFDFSVDGHLSNQRVFYKHQGPGGPDGFRVDADGNIWHAIYGESRVIKISPQGKIIGQVSLPTKNITCVEFVGTEIFITTASDDEAKGGERSKETGGALFRCEVGVTGPPVYEFKLENAKA